MALTDRYWLERVLGHGASGTVYAAVRSADGERVAIKEILVGRGEVNRARARREAAAFGGLDHPGIPRLIDSFVVDADQTTIAYLVLERVDGESLRDELTHRRHTVGEVFERLAEVLEILVHLHGRDPALVHRDVKLDNLLRRPDGRLVLVDFGSATMVAESTDDHFTATGTVGYMPVEQIAGVTRPENDIYAVGALAVALLTREDPSALLDAHQRLRWEERVVLHPRQRRWLRALLARDPSERPNGAAKLAGEARELARLNPGARSRWGLRGLVAVASIVALGVAVLFTTLGASPSATAASAAKTSPRPGIDGAMAPVAAAPVTTPPTPPPRPTSACAATGTCRALRTFEGIDVDDRSAFGAAAAGGVVTETDEPFDATIAGVSVPCRRRVSRFGVSVTCYHARGRSPHEIAAVRDEYLQYLRDTYGPELSGGGASTHWRADGGYSLEVSFMGPAPGCEGRGCVADLRTHFHHLGPPRR